MSDTARRLRHVLSGTTFPADRWELLAAAELYGADRHTRHELRSIPARRYHSFSDLVSEIERTGDGIEAASVA